MRDSDEPIQPSLTEAFKVHGEWWLPYAPEERVSGLLVFEPGRFPTLTIKTCFPSLPPAKLLQISSRSLPVALITGRSDRGRSWSVVNCIPVNFPADLRSDKLRPVEFSAEYLLASSDPLPDEVGFLQLHLQYTHLAEWVCPFPTQKVKMPSVQIRFSIRDKCHFITRISEPRGKLALRSHFSPVYVPGKMQVEASARWEFTPKIPLDLKGAMSVARDCQNLLTILINRPAQVSRISGVCRARNGTAPLGVDIITSLTRVEQTSLADHYDWLLSFEDFKSFAPDAVKEWFAKQNELREVVDLILASRYIRGYITTEFLNLTQALEALHRRIFKGSYYSEDGYDAIYKALVDGIPPQASNDFRQKLMSVYKYANEYTFRRRFKELCRKLTPATRGQLGDVESFVEKVRTTRNYLTHLDEAEREGSFVANQDELSDLWRANERLKGLATVHLLKQIGIPEDKVAGRAFRSL